MKYTSEVIEKITKQYLDGMSAAEIAEELGVSDRSVISKLSHLGIYKRKQYVNKLGEPTVRKEEYIDRIAVLLNINAELIGSLEKVNKSVLVLLEKALSGTD